MNLLKHLKDQPFLFAVSVAAITHSTWSFAVMFTGTEPSPQFQFAWFAWIIPGALLAFSIDIGLLNLAYQIRGGQRSIYKLLAFVVLSLAMFYAQFIYFASHTPDFPLAAGVRADWRDLVQLIRDCSIWIFPALLPTALVLYAFSDTGQVSTTAPSDTDRTDSEPIHVPGASLMPALPAALPTIEVATSVAPVEEPAPALEVDVPQPAALIMRKCPDCGMEFEKATEIGAENALKAHRRHCTARQVQFTPTVEALAGR